MLKKSQVLDVFGLGVCLGSDPSSLSRNLFFERFVYNIYCTFGVHNK